MPEYDGSENGKTLLQKTTSLLRSFVIKNFWLRPLPPI